MPTTPMRRRSGEWDQAGALIVAAEGRCSQDLPFVIVCLFKAPANWSGVVNDVEA